MVLAASAMDPAEVAVPEGPGAAVQVLGRPAAVLVVAEIPRPVHRGEGTPQHAAEAQARNLLAARAARGDRRRAPGVRPERSRRAVFLPGCGSVAGRRCPHAVVGGRRPGDPRAGPWP